MRRWRMVLKLLGRDSRSGELTLLVLALLIAVSSSTAISLFADRLQRTMAEQAAEFLAGDLVLTGAAPIDAGWLAQADGLGLQHSQTSEFLSMLLENDEMLLAAVKSVSDDYPLRGQLKTSDGDLLNEIIVQHGPEPGTAWVDKWVLSALKLKLGDVLTVGEKTLTIARVLSYEPDKRSDFYSFSPRVMINQADLQATAVIQPGSRVRYGVQFRGEETALANLKNALKPQLTPSQKILDIHNDRPELGSALQRAERYLGLSSVLVILIAGVAIAMATRRYSERHFSAIAVLRCLGATKRDITLLYGGQFLVLGVLSCGLGCGLGWLAQFGLFQLLKTLLPQQLANPSWLAVSLGFITGMAILLAFALPPLLRLQRVSPLRVLRHDLAPLPSSAWLIYGLAVVIVSALVWRYSNDPQLTAIIVGVGLLALLALGLAMAGLLRLMARLLPRMGLRWRFGLKGLLRDSKTTVVQLLAFTITLTAMALSFTVRSDLIADWQRQLPQQAPNHFALNILADRQQEFQNDLQQAQIVSSQFYPVVRGRLVAINQEDVHQRVSKDSQGEEATQRELSLTWSAQLPEDNQITAGDAWQGDKPGLVSVEKKLADNLKIQPGDQLLFNIGGTQVNATVSNIRTVEWDTMRPNFYMIFSPGTLDGLPTTYMTSFHLAAEQKLQLLALLKKYPATTVLEVEQIVKQLQTILAQLTQAINLLFYFALAAGFTVLFASVYATLDQRIYEGAVMRTLGARRGFLRLTHIIEFGLLGMLAGALAVVTSEAILYALYTRVMHIDYRPGFLQWLLLPAIGACGIGVAGYWGVHRVVNHSPLRVLGR